MSDAGDDFDFDFWEIELEKLGKLNQKQSSKYWYGKNKPPTWVDLEDTTNEKDTLLANLKSNLNVRKVITPMEHYLLNPIRQDRLQALQFSVNNLKLELTTFGKRQTKNYIVKVHYGQQNQKRVRYYLSCQY